MVFDTNRFVRVTLGFNSGQITTSFNPSVVPIVSNGPAFFTYASAGDTIAQIGAANYFSEVVYDLAINDWILATGSDASAYYQVSAVDRDANPGTVALISGFPTGVIGTANINNLAVTTGKLADDSVTAAKLAPGAVSGASLDPTVLQYEVVPVTASQFNGMYAAPKLLVAAGGADTLLVLDKLVLVMTYGTAAYAAGGVAAVQWDSTVNGAGVNASTTVSAASFQATADTSFTLNGGIVVAPFATTVNKGLYLSNITAAYTTGDSDFEAHVWYKTIPTA